MTHQAKVLLPNGTILKDVLDMVPAQTSLSAIATLGHHIRILEDYYN
jgi:hypothetical protein